MFDEQRFFEAHESFEDCWNAADIDESDRDFWKGVTQVAVGCCHAQRENRRGALALLARAADYLRPFPSPHRGVDTLALISVAGIAADQVRRHGASAGLDYPKFPVDPCDAGSPYDLNRFVQAQEKDYEVALSELEKGQKRSHWMWYIFPQFDGLGLSATSKRYSIKSVAEAEAYLQHPILGPRLTTCAEEVFRVNGRSAYEIFGSPDEMKLKSSATLFNSVSPAGSVFERLLEKYFQGKRDQKTLQLMEVASE